MVIIFCLYDFLKRKCRAKNRPPMALDEPDKMYARNIKHDITRGNERSINTMAVVSLNEDGGRSELLLVEAITSSWTCGVLPRTVFAMTRVVQNSLCSYTKSTSPFLCSIETIRFNIRQAQLPEDQIKSKQCTNAGQIFRILLWCSHDDSGTEAWKKPIGETKWADIIKLQL